MPIQITDHAGQIERINNDGGDIAADTKTLRMLHRISDILLYGAIILMCVTTYEMFIHPNILTGAFIAAEAVLIQLKIVSHLPLSWMGDRIDARRGRLKHEVMQKGPEIRENVRLIRSELALP
jgi:hypothetical protein